jgi:hypothetical protein
MATHEKDQPNLQPAPPDSLRENLAAQAERGPIPETRVSLRIGGGLPSQSFHLEVEAAGDESGHSRIHCELSGRSAATEKTRLEAQAFQGLLGEIVKSGVLSLREERTLFLPDTLVGILEISDGKSLRRYYFAADPDQAETQGKVPPPELQKAIDAVYRLGSRLTGLESVKP